MKFERMLINHNNDVAEREIIGVKLVRGETTELAYNEASVKAVASGRVLEAYVLELQRTLEESQRSETILTAKYSDAIAVCEQLQSELSALKAQVEELRALLRQFVGRSDISPFGDWACRECRPFSDMLKEGFQCAYHAAKAALAKGDAG